MFHKSFSKKDLIEILEILNIEIEDVKDYDKKQLVCHFQKYLDENAKGLFLPNMNKAKKLNAYCKNGCSFSEATYTTIEDILEDVNTIISFGDSPTVRKAIHGINNDPKIKDKFFPVISEKCRAKMEEKKKIRQAQIGTAKVTHGHFVISFD